MSGTLYVVATPIGNLEDITLRAKRVLREVNLIAAEDTRRTARLLRHYAIVTRTISFHAHNTHSRVPQLIERLLAGESIAVVTDAGTPGVSDPGLELVQAAISNQIPVDPIPGASAPLTALIASGFPIIPFTLFGFPPHRSNDRIDWLRRVVRTPHTFSFFEAPHRIQRTLRDAADLFGERPIFLGRELTKMHQELLRGTAAELANRVRDPKGEFTVVVGPQYKVQLDSQLAHTDQQISREFCYLTESCGASRREAVRQLARSSGRTSKEVYSAIERTKKLGHIA
jgi:16S rRNA (cytidine1402-2'-O)-methyltransferase